MPVDMVKILKTQDENYVRTMRSSNAKVRSLRVRRGSWNLKLFSQKIDRIKSQLTTMSDLVHEGGGVGEEELPVLEKSGVLVSRKLKGKAKVRSLKGPTHIVFVEEGAEGKSPLIFRRARILNVVLDTYEGPSNDAPTPETVPSDDESEIDLGWKPEGHQKRNKGKQKSHGQDHSNLQLLEEESQVRCTLVVFDTLTDPRSPCLETSTAAGSRAFGSDGAGSTVTVCRAGAGDAEVTHGERSDEEAEGG